jgi:hypothetical protein
MAVRQLISAGELKPPGILFVQSKERAKVGGVQGIFREHSGNIQGTFRERPGKVQGTLEWEAKCTRSILGCMLYKELQYDLNTPDSDCAFHVPQSLRSEYSSIFFNCS